MADDVSRLLAQLQAEMMSGFDGLRQEMNDRFREVFSHFDAIYTRFDRLESEYQTLAAAVSRLETRSLSRAEFEREVEQLRSRVHQLEHRIDEIEKMQREN